MNELELIIDRLQNPAENDCQQLVDQLVKAIDHDPPAGLEFLVHAAQKDAQKIYTVVEQLERRGQEKAGNLKDCVLLSLENQFIGQPVVAQRAVATGWKISSNGQVMGLYIDVAEQEGDSLGVSAYTINLLLDEDYKIAQIVRYAHKKLTDEWDLEIARLLGKTKQSDSIPEEINCFPVYMHKKLIQKLEEII